MPAPWPHWQGYALCELGWPPREFWHATLADVLAAANYQRDAHSGLDTQMVKLLKQKLSS